MSNRSGIQQLPHTPTSNSWRRRLATPPPPEAEDSILLRVLAQALVIIGIIATDVAASGITEWVVVSYWAVPFSIIGAFWSWHRRHKRNIATKFCLAIGMLLVLAAFFLRLVGELNDTRLALAQLLIQLQILHSFDLPRRKDLGYSMIIGLILIGVAGTLSQTLAFGPFLLLFVAIALPVLVLDYRSRLGLVLRSLKPQGTDLAPRRLGLFLAVIVALGLTIFLLLPRLPGYQLRTFPVSAPVEFQGEFDGRSIINPGYARQGRQNNRDGAVSGDTLDQSQGQGRGAGKLDETFYYGFDRQINQNLRGQLKPQVVMRVRSQSEGFWRALAFDRYTGQGWEISRNDQAQTVKRPSWSYQFFLPRSNITGLTKEVIQTYTIVSDLPNIIPALYYPEQLYFPTKEVAIDPEGSLRAPLGLSDGFTYTVISEVPYRNRTLLRQASTKYPSAIRKHYLQLPPEIAVKVRQRTEEILATSSNPLTDPYEKSLYLAQYLKWNYPLLPELPAWRDEADMVEEFLFVYKGGYADHFSTTLTVMLRSIGIPTRLVTGFGPGQFNPFTGLYVVQNTDAYALTEVYFPGYGWFAFDPIPGHELVPPSIEEHQTFSALQQFWQWIAGWLPTPLRGWLDELFNRIGNALARIVGWLLSLFSRGWIGLFIGLILAISIGFLGWLSWSGWKTWRYHYWLSKLPPVESLYQQMLTWLASQGFRKRPAQTPLEYAQQMRSCQPPNLAQTIDEISQAYVSWRYGQQKPDLRQLKQQLQNLKKQSSNGRFRIRNGSAVSPK